MVAIPVLGKFQPSEGCIASDGGVCQIKSGDNSEKVGTDFTVLSWQDIFKNTAGCMTVIMVLVAIVACLILIDIKRRRQHRQIRRSMEVWHNRSLFHLNHLSGEINDPRKTFNTVGCDY